MGRPDKTDYTVSVVIPAYNVEKYIGRAIDSVLAQTRRPDEIIVVDDGSTDNTAEVIRSYGSKVCFIRQENAGASVARNTGVQAATSEWIAFLDADDEWLPEKLQLQIEHLKRNPELVWSYSNYVIRPIAENTERLTFDPTRYEQLQNGKEYFDSFFEAFMADVPLSTITVIIRSRILIETGLFLVGQMWAQDTDMFFRVAYKWPKIGYIPRPLSINHFGRNDSITQKNKYRVKQQCDLIGRHLKIAAQYGRLDDFRPCAVKMLQRWLRGYADNRAANISEMVERFGNILPWRLKIEMRLRTAMPRLAPKLFDRYFAMKNRLLFKK